MASREAPSVAELEAAVEELGERSRDIEAQIERAEQGLAETEESVQQYL